MGSHDGEDVKFPNGDELLLGRDMYGRWVVSKWNKNVELLFEKLFDKRSEAKAEFDRLAH